MLRISARSPSSRRDGFGVVEVNDWIWRRRGRMDAGADPGDRQDLDGRRDLATALDHSFEMDRPLEPRMSALRDDHRVPAGAGTIGLLGVPS